LKVSSFAFAQVRRRTRDDSLFASIVSSRRIPPPALWTVADEPWSDRPLVTLTTARRGVEVRGARFDHPLETLVEPCAARAVQRCAARVVAGLPIGTRKRLDTDKSQVDSFHLRRQVL
jgi:hypothetical protein